MIDPIRAPVIDSKSFPKTTIRVVKENNIPIEGDVTSVRFYFWNNGREPIRRENILNPIVVFLSDKSGEILDYRLLSLSRPEVINATVERNEHDPKTSVKISFRILEKYDGFTGQLLYSGDPNANLIIKGVIEGVKEIETNASLSKFAFYKHIFLNFVLPMLSIIVGFLIIWSTFHGKRAAERSGKVFVWLEHNLGEKIDRISPTVARLLWVVIPIIFLIMIGFFAWKDMYPRSQGEINKSLIRIIPSEIRP